MPAQRSDAVRSRARILEVARGREPHALRLNEVAREAGVGVGTVYRHFPTVQALVEALSVETLERLREVAREAAREPDPGAGVARMLRGALALQLEDGGLQSVILAPEDGTPEVRELKRGIFADWEEVLTRARASGALRHDVTTAQLEHLVCGVEHAVRLGSPVDRDVLLDVVLAGLSGRAD